MSASEIDLMTPVYIDLANSVMHIGKNSVIAMDTLRLIMARWDAEGWPENPDEIAENLRKVLRMSDFERLLEPERVVS